MTTRTPARRRTFATPELDRAIDAAESEAIVMWRSERVRFAAVPERVARIDDRGMRDRLYTAYLDALEALNPLYEQRLAAWREAGDIVAIAARKGPDPAALAVDLERFSFNMETSYYAALRRYLALIDIEQGDASEADLWHIVRGTGWAHWFGDRELRRAVTAAGRGVVETTELEGWRAAEQHLSGGAAGGEAVAAEAAGAAYATLAGSPEWLADELGMVADEVTAFVDFAAFVRLLRLRRAQAELHYELRLYATDDPALQRAYYSGIVGHTTGVTVPEAGYLAGIPTPFASARRLQVAILAAMLVETLEQRHGLRWWREPEATATAGRVAAATSADDGLAELGYDALDWRPVLRQIRTRLIGEMSGYGGPNITTRAGTRKV